MIVSAQPVERDQDILCRQIRRHRQQPNGIVAYSGEFDTG
jgi:hypothetical protein